MNAPDRYLHLDAQFVKAEIGKLIAAYPELAEDESLRLDMIEGSTTALGVIERALAERQEAEMLAGAIQARMVDLSERQARFVKKSEAMKSLIKAVMKAALLDKLTLPDATLSITKPRESIGIINLEELPQGFYRTIRQADKAAIKDALAAGQDVPGAALVIGEAGLSIRTK